MSSLAATYGRDAPFTGLGWGQIARLGLVQASIGSIVLLMTSTFNRVMAVELGLAVSVPSALVGLHYAVQLLRPLFGHRSDIGGSRTRWIIGGMVLLAISATLASHGVRVASSNLAAGLATCVVAFAAIGFGIGAAGTSVLALLAARTAPGRRPAAATLVWTLMIAGIVAAAATVSMLLDPFSFDRLVAVTAGTGAVALMLTVLAVWGIERSGSDLRTERDTNDRPPFREALRETWNDAEARVFTLFVFVSMLAYSAQDHILEPFGGLIHFMTPGETTALSGSQHQGVLLGMIAVGTGGSWLSRRWLGALKAITIGGCVLSAAMLAGLALSVAYPGTWPISLNVFALGFSNGAFAVAAIGSMMALASAGPSGTSRAGVRMGVWGAAQAIAFGLGGLLGAFAVDIMMLLTGEAAASYRMAFSIEALTFIAAALVAIRLRLRGAVPAMMAPEADAAFHSEPTRSERTSRPATTMLEPAE